MTALIPLPEAMQLAHRFALSRSAPGDGASASSGSAKEGGAQEQRGKVEVVVELVLASGVRLPAVVDVL